MKLKKRLPALFLALFLAFSPLMLAFPANASSDVFSDSGSYSFFDFDDVRFVLPSSISTGAVFLSFPDPNGPPNFCLVSTSSPRHLFYSIVDSDFSGFFNFRLATYDEAVVYIIPFTESSVFDFRTASSVSFSESALISDFLFVFGDANNLASVPDGFNIERVSLSSVSFVGALSVFSGVGSWLGGAVNNMISMFYTADSGLTVLGVLAVASLALAFILLLLYLIAGWLKFR